MSKIFIERTAHVGVDQQAEEAIDWALHRADRCVVPASTGTCAGTMPYLVYDEAFEAGAFDVDRWASARSGEAGGLLRPHVHARHVRDDWRRPRSIRQCLDGNGRRPE